MPAPIGLVGFLKKPEKNKCSKNRVIMPFLGYFGGNFLFHYGR